MPLKKKAQQAKSIVRKFLIDLISKFSSAHRLVEAIVHEGYDVATVSSLL